MQVLSSRLAEQDELIQEQAREINQLKMKIEGKTKYESAPRPDSKDLRLWEMVDIDDQVPDLNNLWITKKAKISGFKLAKKSFKANALTLKNNVHSKISSNSLSISPRNMYI